MLNLNIADRILNCMEKQVPQQAIKENELVVFAENVFRLFDKAAISSSLNKTNEKYDRKKDPLHWLQDLFLNESRKVSLFLRNIVLQNGIVTYEGSTTGYHDFLLPFIKFFQKLSFLQSAPVYLMIDDADSTAGVGPH